MNSRKSSGKARFALFTIALSAILAAGASSAATLGAVKSRGTLNCGVSEGLKGFSDRDKSGKWWGFDVDFCRALAAAIFDDTSKVTYVPLSATDRFDALRSGKVDVLSRNSTWTFERETRLGLLFAGTNYYDGQGFLVLGKPDIQTALELNGTKICVQTGTTSRPNLADYFRANSMKYTEVTVASLEEMHNNLKSGKCSVFTADQSALFSERQKLAKPDDAVVLPDIISKEPLGPVVRSDDLGWYNIVKWMNFALINAEELGISQATVKDALESAKPDVRRFTGKEGNFGILLGLDNAWAVQAVKAVGNYGEIFKRNIGAGSALAIPRGMNQLWNQGGILYAPPLR
jgi:general L-amino acid transport system substrate-binding protein